MALSDVATEGSLKLTRRLFASSMTMSEGIQKVRPGQTVAASMHGN
jgi:hypothetical protein